jgi:hypothetical protein
LVAILIIVPLLGAVILKIAGGKHPRTSWIISLGIGLIAWLSSIILLMDLPANIHSPIWKPETLFPTPIALSVDLKIWPILFITAGALLAVLLILPSESDVASDFESNIFLFALGLAAVLAGNLLTLVAAWALIDFYILMMKIRGGSQSNDVVNEFSLGFLGITILLAASGISWRSAGGDSFINHEWAGGAYAAVVIAVALRIGLSLYDRKSNRAGMTFAGNLLLILSGLAVLERISTPEIMQEFGYGFSSMGFAAIILGGLGWIFSKQSKPGMAEFGMIVFGVGILFAAVDPQHQKAIFVGIGGLILLKAIAELTSEKNSMWDKLFKGALAAFLLWFSAMQGSQLIPLRMDIIQGSREMIYLAIGIIGMLVLSIAHFSIAMEKEKNDLDIERTVKAARVLGLAISLTVVLVGNVWNREINRWTYIAFGFLLLIAALGFFGIYAMRRRAKPIPLVEAFQRFKLSFSLPRIGSLNLIRPIKVTADIFEGDAGMLWVLVVFQVILLALGGGVE